VTSALKGRSVAVVGASSGIGRGVALRAIQAGADVILAARRVELLEDLVRDAGGGFAMACDVVDDDAGERLAAAVRGRADHLDVLFVSTGAAPLRRMAVTSAEEWRGALETNVIGINRVIAATLDLLRPESVVAVVSSEAAVAPRSHLGAYGASKAALEHSIEQWREEHPWLRLSTISLGATVPTEFGRHFDQGEIIQALDAWTTGGRNQAAFMDTEQVCDLLVDVLGSLIGATSVGLPHITLRSPSPNTADAELVKRIAEASDPAYGTTFTDRRVT
jgi:NAD(P)-dependent dehydrogenase (short-subunit alcohol dehydrogenase family)